MRQGARARWALDFARRPEGSGTQPGRYATRDHQEITGLSWSEGPTSLPRRSATGGSHPDDRPRRGLEGRRHNQASAPPTPPQWAFPGDPGQRSAAGPGRGALRKTFYANRRHLFGYRCSITSPREGPPGPSLPRARRPPDRDVSARKEAQGDRTEVPPRPRRCATAPPQRRLEVWTTETGARSAVLLDGTAFAGCWPLPSR